MMISIKPFKVINQETFLLFGYFSCRCIEGRAALFLLLETPEDQVLESY